SVCDNCQTKSICNLKGNQDNSIEITDKSGIYKVGDEVNLILKKSLGYAALFLGYLLPLIIVLLFLFLFLSFGKNEILAGLGSLLLLAAYYLILYLIRNNISNKFKISLEKSTTG
ncbi:MAG: SoxR reducing system RseC family protein, partial [Bacteroidales bacterium]